MLCLQNELRRLEGIEHAEHELNMLQQAHAIATAQQELARLAAADQREAVAQHEHRLQQMHDAQASTHTKQQWPIARNVYICALGFGRCKLLSALTSADIHYLY